jgi:primosomal protein N' (replication factor Y) (superfamily II helicase)
MSAVASLPARRPFAEVAVAVPVGGTFHYLAPPPLDSRLALGHRVLVPFGRRQVTGYVVGFPETAEVSGLKAIEGLLDDGAPLVPPALLDLLRDGTGWRLKRHWHENDHRAARSSLAGVTSPRQ